ncbi:MAG TPA: phospholipase D family protein [Gammaproteobacteria bacterium]|jgi:phosphatidylserine/phosphatidylglycerophosphate/cardiolipin synthase-like enzyme|nr:phospholipase D family protein [Gammaproteobacteria bacterium]
MRTRLDKIIIFCVLGLIIPTTLWSATINRFAATATYQVCFTPGANCTQLIVTAIDQAKQAIYVQAYSFTSPAIAKALVNAKNRGVRVKVILDKSQYKKEKYSSSTYLANQGIPVWVDYRPHIAHNKVMIIDNTLITGSFNFTKSAQERNAENVLIIKDKDLANQYLVNWYKRQQTTYSLKQYERVQESKNAVTRIVGLRKLSPTYAGYLPS